MTPLVRPHGALPVWHAMEIFADVFGPLGRVEYIDSRSNTAVAVVFEAFEFRFGYEYGHGQFLCDLRGAPRATIGTPDTRLAPDSSPQSVRQAFAQVQRWCRLRLPEDYVAELERAHGVPTEGASA